MRLRNTAQHPSRYCALLRRITPVLLQPKLFTLKNRLVRRGGPAFADLLTTAVTLFLMAGLFVCCKTTIAEWRTLSGQAEISTTLLGGTLGALFLLVLLSSAVTSIGSLFMGKDVERLLASPLSPEEFLSGKTLEVGASSIWMLAIFFIPLYLAFGVSSNAHLSYFLATPILMLLFLGTAVLSGILSAILFSAIIPVRVGRNIFVVLFVLVLALVLASLRLLPGSSFTAESLGRSDMPLAALSLVDTKAMPTYWIGLAMRKLLVGELEIPLLILLAVCTATAVLWLLVRFAFTKLHHSTYSRLQVQASPLHIVSPANKLLWLRRGLGRNRHVRALMSREFFSFTRDITHTVQLGMLLAICVLYLYSLQSIEPPTHVGTLTLQAWDMCAILSSIVLSSVIILSICARFVFPSVSLEGQALWILQTAPMKSRDILRAKVISWFIPTAMMSAVIFSSGGLALGLQPLLVLSLVATGAIIAYGLVALGVGIGARFARFDWEHPTELSTSWGNLVYTLCGLMILTLSLIPISLMFGLLIFFPAQFQDDRSQVLLIGAALGIVLIIHCILAKIMLSLGVRALDGLQRQ
jgi:ABC-2 type transport system permease protein